MRQLLWGVVGLALAGTATAQIVIQQGVAPLFPDSVGLVNDKDIQTDLKLTADQVKKVAALAQKQRRALTGLHDFQKIRAVGEAGRKDLAEVLTAEQTKRLGQLEVQQRGAGAFFDANLARDLNITGEQRTAILKIIQGASVKLPELYRQTHNKPDELAKRLTEHNRTIVASILKTLSPEQQAKWQGVAGEPYAGTLVPAPALRMAFVDPRPAPVHKWIMNDLGAAQAEARKTGKPIFATFRCEA